MAPNSLFAILLRSRWWVSCLVAAGVVLVGMAVVPQPYKIAAALGSLPFWALGLVALVRQWSAPNPAQTQQRLEQAAHANWSQFANQLERAWQAEGYMVERIGSQAADFYLTRNGRSTLVQAKRWKAAHHGIEPLRELEKARMGLHADEAAYVALHPLHTNAAQFADAHHIALLQGDVLAGLLHKIPD